MIDPIIKTLYSFHLYPNSKAFNYITLIFLFEGFGGKRSVDFAIKYGKNGSLLKTAAKNCKKIIGGKFEIDWLAVEKEIGNKWQ